MTAIELVATADVGAYVSSGRAIDGPCQVMYLCPNVSTELRSVMTNTGPHVSFRGPGYVEGAFPLESLMDELAKRLEIDPVEIRMKNYTPLDLRTDRNTRRNTLINAIKKAPG